MKQIIQIIMKNPSIRKLIVSFIDLCRKLFMYSTNKIIGINENKIVFISFDGKSYSDNPKAISEKLHELYPNFEIVWLFNNPKEKSKIVPKYVKCVNSDSYNALKELATAKFWVDNFCKPLNTYKSKNQIYIQTWHGDRGFKKILHDSNFVPPNFKVIESDICDLAISGSKYGNMQYISAFKYEGEIQQVGYPRNDILVNKNRDIAKSVKKALNIKLSTNILLYAPTLRRESTQRNLNQEIKEINLIEVLNTLEEKTDEDWICLVRAHSAVSGLSGIPYSGNIIDVSSYEDMSELLLISDMLITDYSSSAGDFALLERPIILFQNDRDEYLEKDRAFYFEIEKSPFIIAMSQPELIKIIKEFDKSKVSKNCKAILDFYDTNETGKSSEAVANFIFAKLGVVKQ
jgi:CDP-glycerol glycerophosphotransferase